MPVNVGSGAMLTEARGIFIKGLSYQAKPNDVNALLSKVAIPVEVKLHKDSRSGQFRGSATAKFATKEEAVAVVNSLGRTVHMGKTIEVRLDTERTVVGQTQGPVIVNGSTFSRVSSKHAAHVYCVTH
jgi:RNA recognition motif-containing protein